MAHILPNAVLRRIRGMVLVDPSRQQDGDATSSNNDKGDNHSNAALFEPDLLDIAVVHVMLNRTKKLPPDLVDLILDYAEYWAHSSNEIDFVSANGAPDRVNGRSQVEDKLLIRSYPLGMTKLNGERSKSEWKDYVRKRATAMPLYEENDPKFFKALAGHPMPTIKNPARKVVFSVKGKDQGWGVPGDRGSYDKSWSWYEAGLERFQKDENGDNPSSLSAQGLRPVRPSLQNIASSEENSAAADREYDFPLEPQRDLVIHRNRVGDKHWQNHVVTWSYLDNTDPESDAGQALQDEGRGRATGNGQFVRDLKLGDVITIWSKARFPGWVSQVESVKIDVYWTLS